MLKSPDKSTLAALGGLSLVCALLWGLCDTVQTPARNASERNHEAPVAAGPADETDDGPQCLPDDAPAEVAAAPKPARRTRRSSGPVKFKVPKGVQVYTIPPPAPDGTEKLPPERPLALASARPASKTVRVANPRSVAGRKIRAFSFAVISDTHSGKNCSTLQGKWLDPAVAVINRRKPAFVVGLGDLVAGGGDCANAGGAGERAGLDRQLQVFKEKLLKKLKVPFVPVAGNHDLGTANSSFWNIPFRVWKRFWKENKKHLLRQAAKKIARRSYRFTYRGVGFSMIGYYDTHGLKREELQWVKKKVKKYDLVFRHINPYGISTTDRPDSHGFAIRSYNIRRYERLTELLKKMKVRTLFSGHTHAFYEGLCDGLHFINTGTLADRSMEFVKGWEQSPFRNRQAFVWVDVLSSGTIKVSFYVYVEKCRCFLPFDKNLFPGKVVSERVHRDGFDEGVAATCRPLRFRRAKNNK